MDNMPMISVIMPTYNAEQFVSEAIESVLKQTYSQFELLIINDGSTDHTGEVCKKYAENSDKIRYFEKDNSGVSDTRNYGIDHAKGEFVVFLDADDTLSHNALSTYMDVMVEGTCDAVYAGYRYVYDNSYVDRIMRLPGGVYSYEGVKENLLDDGTITGILFGSVCAACYRLNILENNRLRFRKEVQVNEDGLFNIEFMHVCGSVKVINEIVYNYRQWKNTKKIPLQRDVRFVNAEPIIIDVIDSFNEESVYRIQTKRRQVSVMFWHAIRIRNSQADHKTNLKYLRELFSEEGIRECYPFLDYKKMNRSKRMLCFLMKNRMTLSFYFLVKYIAPLLSGMIKR